MNIDDAPAEHFDEIGRIATAGQGSPARRVVRMEPRCGNRSRTGLSGRSGAVTACDLRHSRWRFGFRDSLACSPRRGHNQPADCQDAARHASFEVSLRSSAMVVRLDPVGVLGARPAVLAHERAVDRRVHEHQGGGHSAFGGEIRSHALPSRLRSDSACAAAATGSTSAACPRPDRPRRIRRPEADSYSALSRCWRPGAGCSSRP